MTHQLTDVRAALIALLRGRTAAGVRVYGTRFYPLHDARLPCVLVYTDGRRSEKVNEAPLTVRHNADIFTEICVAACDAADEQAETLLRQVEQLVYASPTLDGELADDLLPADLATEVFGAGERQIAVYRQSWRGVWYESPSDYVGRADLNSEATSPQEISAADTRWDLAPKDGRIDATDHIPLNPEPTP
ncbi:hypothetical protein [Crenobacter cavernae]|uniref:Uncharacterized protein n=1 Tax=Crenobacter cavernae TaxID=2290923 RepID=A0A345Y6S1_9NEIS|nr:hypothetical protein [Crenobacter cavernae]AXK39623.1 hypothetical protein DWG20_09300 [Crenobacter cavernae]